MLPFTFEDRFHAGRLLAGRLEAHRGSDALVLGLPHGGVPVAYEVARLLGLALDVLVVRRVGLPQIPELAVGAVAGGGIRVINEDVLEGSGLDEALLERLFERESAKVLHREQIYRQGRPSIEVKDRTAILVDDGLATGASMLAAIGALRVREARAIVVAVPVAPRETYATIRSEVDEMVCLHTPHRFVSVGRWYEDFSQTSDDEVRRLLACLSQS